MFRRLKEALSTEVGVMCLVLILYLVKVPAKLALGLYIHSPVIYGDAWHNLADMVQSALVVGAIFFRRIPNFLVSLVLAAGLIYAACDIGVSSWGGILQNFPAVRDYIPAVCYVAAPETLIFGVEYLGLLIGVLVVCILFSVVVGWWQHKIGSRLGNSNIVLNGKETLGDAAIEFAILVGVLGEYAFNIPWFEYPLGLAIAAILMHAGVETLLDQYKCWDRK